MFNASGEIQLPRVVWFILIGLGGGIAALMVVSAPFAIFIFYYIIRIVVLFLSSLLAIGFIIIALTVIKVVHNRRGAEGVRR
jgi:hypothetical protein